MLRACMLSRFSHVGLFETPWIVAREALLSIEFSRQEYWRGLSFPSPDILPTQRLNVGVSRSMCILYPASPESLLFLFFSFFFIYFYQMKANYFTTLQWVLSYIEMKQPWVYMCSPSRSPLPPPTPPAPSRSSQCTRSERLSHASNLGW